MVEVVVAFDRMVLEGQVGNLAGTQAENRIVVGSCHAVEEKVDVGSWG